MSLSLSVKVAILTTMDITTDGFGNMLASESFVTAAAVQSID